MKLEIQLRAAVMTAIAVVLVFPANALGASPTIEQERTVPVSFAVGDCGAFQIVGSWIVDLRTATFVDSSGTAVSVDFTAHWHGTIANSVTAKSIDDSGSFSMWTDLLTGEQRSAGVVRHDTVPHLGLIWLDAGTVQFDAAGNVTISTPHAFTASTEACVYFA